MARRLLLVEDSSTMRRMIAAMLGDEGYEVATAVDGREGLAKAAETPPELILTDYEMPELDGPGLCQALKAERNRQLEVAQAKLDLELDLARKVQAALMPRPPRPRGAVRLAVRYQPANRLGGDVYDFAPLDDGRLGVLVADISGHGVNSALL